MSELNAIEVNNDCVIYYIAEEDENNVIINYQFKDSKEKLKIAINKDIFVTIFFRGILDCMMYNLDSSYNFDSIEEKDSEISQDYLKIYTDELFFPKRIMDKNKYIVISHQFNIKNIMNNKIYIEYSSKYGFITKLYDNYKKFCRKKYDFKIELDYNKAFELMDFVNRKFN